MRKILLFTILSILAVKQSYSQNDLPYPVIFVHGLAGSDGTFIETMEYLRDHDNLGDINVFDVVLNADDDFDEALMSVDVKWTNFSFGGRNIYVGRRNYAEDIDDFVSGWSSGSNIFAINFAEERIRGAKGENWYNQDYFDQSNEAAIYKQGYALSKMIAEVLSYTGAEKVVLVGHSMGGLCIREYLQRTNSSGTHVNWIDPNSADGHKVARVATYGTPHLGSNTSADPTKSTVPDLNGDTEANRDLLWEYDSYTNCGGTPQGIYMFGGYEECIESVWYNGTFNNVDINCDGDQNDYIVGINEDFNSFDFNSSMPLPLNIKYTYMTSIWGTWNGIDGDGAVDIRRQWLHDGDTPSPAGLTDTTLQDILHTSEGSDYERIIRGIDEPHRFDIAYKVPLNKEFIGYITYQQNLATYDADVFKVACSSENALGIYIDGSLSGVETIGFYDASGNSINSKTVSSFPAKLYVNVPSGSSEIYIKITGTASATTWRNPYKMKIISGSWVGDTSTDWNTASNWTLGVADAYDDVYIPVSSTYMPTVSTDVSCRKADIPASTILTINPQGSVDFLDDLSLNGRIILKSDYTYTASYLDNGNISGTGTVKLEQNFEGNMWHYVSPHIDTANSSTYMDLNDGNTNTNFYLYNELNSNVDWIYGWEKTSGAMDITRGYAYYTPGSQTYFESEGKPNTGSYSRNITNSNYGITSDGWNLLGNPYPSGLSSVDFILGNTGYMIGAVYLWDEDAYSVYNLSGYTGTSFFNGSIAPGQGFFVRANYGGTVNFTNSMRTNDTPAFFKAPIEEDDINRIFVDIENENNKERILLAFTNEASQNYDELYDAPAIKANSNFSFYSILDNYELAIQAFSDFTEPVYEVPFGTELGAAGDYTFTFSGIDAVPADMNIYFMDNLTGSYVDLRTQNTYTAHIASGVSHDRFWLNLTKAGMTDFDNKIAQMNIYNFNKQLYFNLDNDAQIMIYDVKGALLKSEWVSQNTHEMSLNNFETGIYFVKINSDNQIFTKKIVLR